MILALDFDGVICDGLNECLLIAWNAWHQNSPSDLDESQLIGIPDAFKASFAANRNFVRHNGHFIVPFLQENIDFQTQEDFKTHYDSIDAALKARFESHFETLRQTFQTQHEERWLAMHTLYPRIGEVLQNRSHKLYIVSAKDTPSIQLILKSLGVYIPEEHIFGSQKDKIQALNQIALFENVQKDQIVFIDDNLPNIQVAQQNGFTKATWATWGYHIPSDVELQKELQIPKLYLEEFTRKFGARQLV
ncbi:HAD family hydrolase [Deinococcus roseus]|uniref:HAD family hydrolase n=1 Tax=Deinococcus roseus TaxID=392414 RepID=A0ABQ2D9Y1_9DEIO|nr:HAD family hydrolase [Deinococcus roseus]GGJ49532.1 hypothetical protein GCM10008938_39380 [Deinococcus roseus]